MVSGSLSFGQIMNGTFQSASLKLNIEEPQFFVPSLGSSPVVFKSFSQYSPTFTLSIFKSPVHHTAFFCKMEMKAVNRLGIWVKIHAGDYDTYTGISGNYWKR